MPLVRSGDGKMPSWCEMEDFEIISIPHDTSITLKRRGEKEHYMVGKGRPVFTIGDSIFKVPEDGFLSLPPSRPANMDVLAWHADVTLIRVIGHWKCIATSGVHVVTNVDNPILAGTFCLPPSSNGSVNQATGSPGPGTVQTDTLVRLRY